MRRLRSLCIVGVCLSFALAGPIPVHGDATAPTQAGFVPCRSWQASYFDDTRGYAAPPVVERIDARIDFDWGYGPPVPGMVSDHFSVRWHCTTYFEAGTYRFYATSDDGLRLYVDGQPVIEAWFDHPIQTYAGEINLSEGQHQITVVYYENTGVAVARVWWSSVYNPEELWRGEYYDNRWLGGTPVLTRNDKFIDFDWGYGSPDSRVPGDNFSASWTRTVDFAPGTYRFTVRTDDGVRLWVGEQLVIDRWRDQWAQSHSATAYLSGEEQVHMETYEHTGVAVARLRWTQVGEAVYP